MLTVSLAVCVRFGWREYDYRQALRETERAGLIFIFKDPFEFIRKDWRYAFEASTWSGAERKLALYKDAQVATAREHDLFRRLRVSEASFWGLEKLQPSNELAGFGNVRVASFSHCSFQNLQGVEEISALEEILITNCRYLRNVDALAKLPRLKKLEITDCLVPKDDFERLKRLLPGTTFIVLPASSVTTP
jgi:hypothetical protein